MNLSKWQLVGIGLSVLWAMAAFVTVTTAQYDTARDHVAVTHILCAQAKTANNELDCATEERKTWDNWTDGTFAIALAVALLPIPFGWVLADLVVWAKNYSRRKKAKSSAADAASRRR